MSGVNLKRKFKLNEEGNKSIHEVLNSQFNNVGPFSKESDQNDIMSGLRIRKVIIQSQLFGTLQYQILSWNAPN